MNDTVQPYLSITPLSRAHVVAGWGQGLGSWGSAAWLSANRAVFLPVRLRAAMVVAQLFWVNGATVSGNVDAGLYSADGVRIASAGSTGQSGANAFQGVTLGSPVTVGPGLFYVALVADSTSATFARLSIVARQMQEMGTAEMASAFPLPDPAVLATTATLAAIPWVGFASEVL